MRNSALGGSLKALAAAVLSAAIVAGCATATNIRGPSGEPLILIECPGIGVPLGECFKKAESLCPQGYRLVGMEKNDGPPIVTATQFGVMGGTAQQKSIIIDCGKGSSTEP